MWKKDGVFPIEIHETFVILCICVQIQMQQLDIATDKIIELPDVVLCDVVYGSITHIGLNSRKTKVSTRDL